MIYGPPEEGEYWAKASDAAQMVESGIKLSQIAGFMQIPVSARGRAISINASPAAFAR
jgi:hypothetical protein